MSWTHRCRECSLLRVKKEGAICTECQANMTKEPKELANFDYKGLEQLYNDAAAADANELSEADKFLIRQLCKRNKGGRLNVPISNYWGECSDKINRGEPI